ncbi:MAG: proline dehydrogenase family protein, partial [Steroidobacteraceae bacterium]
MRARYWVEAARAKRWPRTFADALLSRFPLGSEQGSALMSLAEALLRTPDAARADQLIAERLDALRLAEGAGSATRSLRLGLSLLGAAGRLLPEVADELAGRKSSTRLLKPVLAPLLRATLRRSMGKLGASFIVGSTIEAALARSHCEPGLALCSFDMLGEGARTEADAQRFFDAYAQAIAALAREGGEGGEPHGRAGISVKLSALEPRYSLLQ